MDRFLVAAVSRRASSSSAGPLFSRYRNASSASRRGLAVVGLSNGLALVSTFRHILGEDVALHAFWSPLVVAERESTASVPGTAARRMTRARERYAAMAQ
jgi:hypothetical protein